MIVILLTISACNREDVIDTNTETSSVQDTITITQDEDEDNVKEPTDEDEYIEPILEDTGVFQGHYIDAMKRLEEMTLEQKVGQIFLARCPEGSDFTSILNYQLGGYVLFKRDFEGKGPEDIRNTIDSYQMISEIPMIMATDEEGGTVVRVSSNPKLSEYKFESPQNVFQNGGYEAIYEDAYKKAKLLKNLGVNLNLAPVSDISLSSSDYIFSRTFGASAEETGEFVQKAVKGTAGGGIGSCLKHFPGYGGNVDTHTGIAVDTRPYSNFEEFDFLPFIAGIESGAPSVLVSHNIVESMDPDFPASLSPKVINVLRENLNFNGVIMTDDLEMDAIKLYTNGENPAVQALKAGNDMLIITDFEEGYDAVLSAVKDGDISEEQLDEAVLRILAFKYYLGIMEP